jgi:type I restriction enzyme S subunit
MSHYKPYPAYKESGVEWIGEVPEHWKTMSLKRVATICNGHDYKDVADPNGVYPVMGSGGEFARASTFLFNGESVLLGRKGTIDKPLYMNGPFWAVDTMFYTRIAEHAFPKFVYYAALNIPFSLYSTNTALPSMTGEDLSLHQICAPDFNEQRKIAQSLDLETARIDALITQKNRFIELLKEKRQALITHAVTKGLDPKVKMKDSGVEWIGEVPEHWEILRLKWVLARRKEKNSPIQTQDILSLTIAQGLVPLSEKEGSGGNLPKDDLAAYDIARPGDLVINSMNVIVGAVGLSRYFGAISPVYYAMFPVFTSTSIEYYHYMFRSSEFQSSLAVLGDGILIKQSESSGKLNTIRHNGCQ